MKRESAIPEGFEALSGRVQYIQKKSNREYTSSCPACGGSVHPDGSWPDRFIMWTASETTGGALAWCRGCGWKWFPEKEEGKKLSEEERERFRQERERKVHEERQAAEARFRRSINLLESERLWERFNSELTETTRALWRASGVPDVWQDLWYLGFCGAFSIWYPRGEEWIEHIVSTMTIPVFDAGWRPLNIRHKILNPPKADDKYRPHYTGLGAPAWMADPDAGWQVDRILVVEGEKKAMVSYLTIDDPKTQVLGIPSKTAAEDLLPKLSGHDVVFLLDDDALSWSVRWARQVRGARVADLPGMKVDDAVLAGLLGKTDLRRIWAQARRPDSFPAEMK